MDHKQVPPEIPQGGNWFLRTLGTLILKVMRFRIDGEVPPIHKVVAIGAPHTSNWDFIIFLGVIFKLGLKVDFLAKHSMFRWPFGWIMRRIGGIPVDRSQKVGLVEQTLSAFEKREKLFLVLSPEGTRSKVARWKTGFHRIAKGAGVPILLIGLDFGQRAVYFGPLFQPGDNLDADIQTIKDFFRPFSGQKPHHG